MERKDICEALTTTARRREKAYYRAHMEDLLDSVSWFEQLDRYVETRPKDGGNALPATSYTFDALLEIAKRQGDVVEFVWSHGDIPNERSRVKGMTSITISSVACSERGFYSTGLKRMVFSASTISDPVKQALLDGVLEIKPDEGTLKGYTEEEKRALLDEMSQIQKLNLDIFVCSGTAVYAAAEHIGETENGFLIKLHETSFEEFWKTYFQDSSLFEAPAIFSEHAKELRRISSLTISDVYKEERSLAIDAILNRVYKTHSSRKFTPEQFQKIVSYITGFREAEKLTRMLLSFNFAYNRFRQVQKGNDFFDLTFIPVSLFKMNEVVFQSLLIRRWPREIAISGKKPVDLADPTITLGSMYQVFKTTDPEISSFLRSKEPLTTELKVVLKRLIYHSRNGFLHKDALYGERVSESIDDSLQTLALLILVFGKD